MIRGCLLSLTGAVALSVALPSAAAGQVGTEAERAATAAEESAYADETARRLHRAALRNWRIIDETIVRYTALVRQRLAVQLRTPLKDRTLYRSESASRVFWDRDRPDLVQALAAREQTPVGVTPPEDFTTGGASGEAFDPAGDRLFFGAERSDDMDETDPEEADDFWFHHPLAGGSTEHYRFESGDTLTLSFPDGRSLSAVELRVLPAVADAHRIAGSLWIEPESGALVRAVYRLADRFDAMRDIPELREEEDLDRVPGLFKPWTFDLRIVRVDYALWDFSVWLPRALRMEGVAAAGILKTPASFDVSYRIESVTTEEDLEREAAGGEPAPDVLEEHRFETREEAMRFLASLIRREEGVEVEPDGGWETVERQGGSTRYLVPSDPAELLESEALPPPIWEDAPGFPTADEIEAGEELLQELPRVDPARSYWAANWGLQRPDLLRYNRIEAVAVGGRFQLRTGSPFGPVSLAAEPFVGVADLRPKLRLSAEWETLRRRTTLSAYHELRSGVHRSDHLDLGNSLNALIFGRDDGEYFEATGAAIAWTPPSAERESWRVRLYGERHRAVSTETDFTLAHAFDDGWDFRPNIEASEHDEFGGEIELRPWWGTDPLAPQFGAELYLHGASGDLEYARSSLLLRASLPFAMSEGHRWRISLEAAGGEAWGEIPIQRNWFLGSSATLRGYAASTLVGEAFVRGRGEVARVFPVVSVALFTDLGWAGDDLDGYREAEALYSVGVGASVLDGLVRLDVARGLRDPEETRWDFYLDAAF